MKPGAISLYFERLVLCLCLVFYSTAARCQPTYGGITVNSLLNLQGNNVTLDSFNSADPNHSIWQTGMTYHGTPYGVYSDSLSYNSNSLPSRTSDCTVATDGSIINVGNAWIYGFVNTAPGGSASINRNGSVGDLNWVSSTGTGIEPGHEETNMNLMFTSENLPKPISNGWQSRWLNIPSPPTGSIINIGGTWTNIDGIWTCIGGILYTNTGIGFYLPSASGTNAYYTQVITNRPENTNCVYYSINQLNQSLFVDAPNVVLYCTNGINLPAGSYYFTLNSNADIQIYSSGNVQFRGIAQVTNATQYARALSFYDVAGYTNLTFSFAGSFGPAFIYAPGSAISLSGGGNQAWSFIGAIFCNDIAVNGHYAFHYDESLAGTAFPISPWISQQPVEQIVPAGSNATFSVEAGGPPLTYQWYFQVGLSNAINGATNSSLTITNAQPPNWGRYSVVVSNPYGSVASSQAWLLVYSNAAAALSSAFTSTNGQFELTVSNAGNLGGMPYTVQASTNLIDWVPIYTNEAPFHFTDTNAFSQRYYRAVFAP